MASLPISKEKLAELMAKARGRLEAARVASAQALINSVPAETSIDFAGTGISSTDLAAGNPEAIEAATDFLADVQETSEIREASNIIASVNAMTQRLIDETPIPEDLSGLSFGDRAARVTLNKEQQAVLDLVLSGADCCMVGKAGTGKTTAARRILEAVMETKRIKPLSISTKWLVADLPGACILSFTNKAVNNIRLVAPKILKPHCLTIHKVLEFAPVFYEIPDPEHEGKFKKTMRFEEQRNAMNPLPEELKLIVFEESSMIGRELEGKLKAAMPHKHQTLYLGDIRQLPPVFGDAVFGFKLITLPVIELTEVYRQALLSPILRLALAIDSGDAEAFAPDREIKEGADGKKRWSFPKLEAWNESNEHGTVQIKCFQKTVPDYIACQTCVAVINNAIDKGDFDEHEDIVLIPYNESFGTIEVNKGISWHLGMKRGERVYEIIAGFNKHYLAVGDRVLYNKEDAIITNIAWNADFVGTLPQPAHKLLDRWGMMHEASEFASPSAESASSHPAQISGTVEENEEDEDDFELMLSKSSNANIEERVNAASHCITLRLTQTSEDDPEREVTLEAAAEVNNLLGGYAITVHKSQGSEYNAVWLFMHKLHSAMVSRELLYTACTRAKLRLEIRCEDDSIYKGIRSQRIKGNTLEEKLQVFREKLHALNEAAEAARRKAEIERLEMNQLCEAQISACIAKLNEKYASSHKPIAEIRAEYASKGGAAGTAYLNNDRGEVPCINISQMYWKHDRETILKDTIPHEVAHIYAWKWFNDYGHGTAWRQLSLDAGGNGQMYHHMENAVKLKTLENAEKAKAAGKKAKSKQGRR